jgi:hypothetical protein
MLKLVGNPTAVGAFDISMKQAADWPPVPGMGDFGFQAIIMGDETAGPYLAVVAIPPRMDPLPLFPAHGHGTDTWRITLRGEMNMGARKYLPGEFRYQAGNKPYGSDDLAWGPDWGFSIVMMADRRGAPSFPPDRDPEKIREARARTRPLYDWLGFATVEDYSGPQGVATTLPRAPRAPHVEGSFAKTDTWQEVTPGVRVSAGLLGHATAGPVLLHIHAEPGCVAFPASRFDTEVLHIGSVGSGAIGKRDIGEGDLRLSEAGAAGQTLMAGEAGYCGTVVFGDRRGLRSSLPAAFADSGAWSAWMTKTLEELTSAASRE